MQFALACFALAGVLAAISWLFGLLVPKDSSIPGTTPPAAKTRRISAAYEQDVPMEECFDDREDF